MEMQAVIAQEDRNVQIWKVKKLIQKLDTIKGNGTSFVSLYVSPQQNIGLVS